ncbi:MAG: hypothetical protein QXH03_08475, partial [Candidatus Bathyarchaeia archaeon]
AERTHKHNFITLLPQRLRQRQPKVIQHPIPMCHQEDLDHDHYTSSSTAPVTLHTVEQSARHQTVVLFVWLFHPTFAAKTDCILNQQHL